MKIKKYIGSNIMIAEDNSIWQLTSYKQKLNEINEIDKFDVTAYTITKNKLYRKFIGLSTYNPIRKLSENEIVDYLHLII
jgi:hypothetical protein